jgi:C-terminal processing protease CtpA/Prc
LNIPDGAVITAVDGTPVSNFYDIIREIRRYPGERITLDYRVNEQIAGSVALNVETEGEPITIKSTFAKDIPFEELTRLYKAYYVYYADLPDVKASCGPRCES